MTVTQKNKMTIRCTRIHILPDTGKISHTTQPGVSIALQFLQRGIEIERERERERIVIEYSQVVHSTNSAYHSNLQISLYMTHLILQIINIT